MDAARLVIKACNLQASAESVKDRDWVAAVLRRSFPYSKPMGLLVKSYYIRLRSSRNSIQTTHIG